MTVTGDKEISVCPGALQATQSEPLAFCTIISKNYLAQARALAESIRTHHPESPLFVLLVDRVDSYFDPRLEPFTVIEIEDVPIPNLPRFCFQYSVLELNTAAKPYFLEYLFANHPYQKLVYFDPDIRLLDRLDAVAKKLDQSAIVLTPHVTSPYPDDGKLPNELTILLAGTYNLGFLALSRRAVTQRFLKWWKQTLYTGCQMAIPQGMHVDQAWVNLVPGYFDDVTVVRKPGYNVAYWNLHERHISRREGRVLVNEMTGYFFHYSGFDPEQPEQLSKHQTRFTMASIGEARRLYEEYAQRLQFYGYGTCRYWPYAFATFDNGCPIPEVARRLYLQTPDVERFGNPFVTEGKLTYWRWLTSATGQDLSPLFMEIYSSRLDLRQIFPDVQGQHRQAYLDWMRTCGMREYHLDPRLLQAAQPECRAAA